MTKQEYQRIHIMGMEDPYSGEFDIKDYRRDLASIVNNAVKSVLPENAFFKIGNKQLADNGRLNVDVFVHKENAPLVEQAMKQQIETYTFKDQWGNPTDKRYFVAPALDVDPQTSRALAREESSTDTENTRFTKSAWLKVIGILTAVADVTRRILSSLLNLAVQTNQDMITAHNLGMSYESVRAYRHVETTHGLKEGTITDAIADIQSKFGNITTLDEKALEALAVVMGGKIEEMATMGLGSSNPEKVLGAILDAFNEKANAGYNSVGQYVGEQQARRELYSYLLKVSPQIADIFATMQEEQHNINSLYRNQADTFENWKNAVPTSRGEHSSAEYNVLASTGQEWNLVKDIFNQIKEGLLVSLAPDVMAILRRLSNVRTGLSELENQELDDRNREANAEFIKSAKTQLEMLGNTEADKQRKLALEYYIKQAEKENTKKSKIVNVVPLSDEIVVKGQKLRASGITNDVYGEAFDYSPAVKNIVERYTPSQELEEYKKQYNKDLERNKATEVKKRTKELEKTKQEQTKTEYDNALAKIEAEHKEELDKHRGKFAGNSGAQAQATIKAKYLYADRKDLWYDKNGKELPLYQQMSNAINAGLVISSGGVTPSYSVPVPEYMKHSVTEAEIAGIKKDVDSDMSWAEESFYISAYRHFNENYMFDKHLAGQLIAEAKKRAEEGTTLYDLDVLQRDYGADLTGLARKFEETYSGTGAILSYATEDNGVIVHKIVFDLNNNGKAEAKDIVLSEYITNRISDTGTVVDKVEITNGRITATGTSASKQKMQNKKVRDRL